MELLLLLLLVLLSSKAKLPVPAGSLQICQTESIASFSQPQAHKYYSTQGSCTLQQDAVAGQGPSAAKRGAYFGGSRCPPARLCSVTHATDKQCQQHDITT